MNTRHIHGFRALNDNESWHTELSANAGDYYFELESVGGGGPVSELRVTLPEGYRPLLKDEHLQPVDRFWYQGAWRTASSNFVRVPIITARPLPAAIKFPESKFPESWTPDDCQELADCLKASTGHAAVANARELVVILAHQTDKLRELTDKERILDSLWTALHAELGHQTPAISEQAADVLHSEIRTLVAGASAPATTKPLKLAIRYAPKSGGAVNLRVVGHQVEDDGTVTVITDERPPRYGLYDEYLQACAKSLGLEYWDAETDGKWQPWRPSKRYTNQLPDIKNPKLHWRVNPDSWSSAQSFAFTDPDLQILHQAVCMYLESEKELREWKQSYCAVESQWDCQKVAQILGIPLGENIREQIEPRVTELLERLIKCEDALRVVNTDPGLAPKAVGANVDLGEWETWVKETATYANHGSGDITYSLLGLIGELGELVNSIVKYYREASVQTLKISELPEKIRLKIMDESYDSLHFLTFLISEQGLSIADTISHGRKKLQRRITDGTVHSGRWPSVVGKAIRFMIVDRFSPTNLRLVFGEVLSEHSDRIQLRVPTSVTVLHAITEIQVLDERPSYDGIYHDIWVTRKNFYDQLK